MCMALSAVLCTAEAEYGGIRMPDLLAGVNNQHNRTSPDPDGFDVVTYRCAIHGDMWRSVVVNQAHRDMPP